MPAKFFCDIDGTEIDGEESIRMILLGGIGNVASDGYSMVCDGCYGKVKEYLDTLVGDNAEPTPPVH